MNSERPGMASAGLTVFFTFLLITLSPVFLGFDDYNPKYADMRDYHAPAVETFAQQLPYPDFTDYGSATTPGLHVFAAIPVRIFGESKTMLQSIACLFGALLVLVVWWFCAKILSPWVAAAATFPLLLNSYVISGSIWFMTDNTAVMLGTIVIGGCLFFTPSVRQISIVGLAFIAAVFVRQSSLWLAAGAWISTMIDSKVLRWCIPIHERKSWSLNSAAVITSAICISLGILIALFISWGGLVPPRFQTLHNSGMNTAVPVVILTSLAAYAFPFLLVHFNRIRKTSNAGTWLIVGFVCGGVLGVSLESTPGVEHGRFGGWVWIIAELCPLFYGRSVFLILGSAAGGATMAGLYILMSSIALRRVQILIWIFLISYVLAMTANSQSFQRYYDAQILVGIAWAMAFSFRSNSGDERKIVIACIAMSAIQLSLSWYSVYSNIVKI